MAPTSISAGREISNLSSPMAWRDSRPGPLVDALLDHAHRLGDDVLVRLLLVDAALAARAREVEGEAQRRAALEVLAERHPPRVLDSSGSP
jgi:hypothetical protein